MHNSLHQRLTNKQIVKFKMSMITLEGILYFMGLNQKENTTFQVQGQPPQSSVQHQQPQSLDGQTNPSMQDNNATKGDVKKTSPTSNTTVWIFHYYLYFIFVEKSQV